MLYISYKWILSSPHELIISFKPTKKCNDHDGINKREVMPDHVSVIIFTLCKVLFSTLPDDNNPYY